MARRGEAEDEMLVLRAREGDNDAHEALLAKWRPFLTSLAKKFRGKAEAEDALSAAYAGYLDAVRSFDPSRGVFKQWLALKAISAIRDLSVKEGKVVAGVDEEAEILDFCGEEVPTTRAFGDALVCFLQQCSREEVTILKLYAEGHSMREVAAHLGCSAKAVSVKMKAIRARFAAYLADKALGEDDCGYKEERF